MPQQGKRPAKARDSSSRPAAPPAKKGLVASLVQSLGDVGQSISSFLAGSSPRRPRPSPVSQSSFIQRHWRHPTVSSQSSSRPIDQRSLRGQRRSNAKAKRRPQRQGINTYRRTYDSGYLLLITTENNAQQLEDAHSRFLPDVARPQKLATPAVAASARRTVTSTTRTVQRRRRRELQLSSLDRIQQAQRQQAILAAATPLPSFGGVAGHMADNIHITAGAGSRRDPFVLDSDEERDKSAAVDTPALEAQSSTVAQAADDCLLPELHPETPSLEDFQQSREEAGDGWLFAGSPSQSGWQFGSSSIDGQADKDDSNDNGDRDVSDDDSVIVLSSDEEGSGPEFVSKHQNSAQDNSHDDVLVLDDSDDETSLSPVRGREEVKPLGDDWELQVRACKQKLLEGKVSEHDQLAPTHPLYTTLHQLDHAKRQLKRQQQVAALASIRSSHVDDLATADLQRVARLMSADNHDPRPPLSDEALEIVRDTWRKTRATTKLSELISAHGYEFSRYDAQFLPDDTWLNDICVNGLFSLIYERSKKNPQLPKVWMFSSFFYTKLSNPLEGYAGVRRWTRRAKVTPDGPADVFAFDMVLFPINVNASHWVCACIDFRKKTIAYYDSYHSSNSTFFRLARTWLEMEHQNKKNAPFDFTGWQDVTKPDCPTQTNAVDCGVFTTRFAEYLSRDADFDFTQDDMAYYRRRMTYELVKVKLMNE
eukprot:m.125537 g.125537  ORF g.125537 m.125537 type:complete len:707 (+) comp15747_c0_seq3:53-2173(+)